MLSEGTKFDVGKPRYDLIPSEPLEALANLYGIGAKKYAERNWEKGMTWGRVFRALCSHTWKWWRGETYDKEDGQHHLIAVAWCAFALYTYEMRKIGTDDRVVGEGSTQTEAKKEPLRQGTKGTEVSTASQTKAQEGIYSKPTIWFDPLGRGWVNTPR